MKEHDEPPRDGPILVSGNYRYMTDGYFACQDAELDGVPGTMPTCADSLDAYVVPIALEKASKAGVAVPDWVLTHEYFPVPAICYGVNPFTHRYAVVRTEAEREPAAKHLTWNFKYTLCCQSISKDAEIVEMRIVGGKTERTELAEWADRLFSIFKIPVATVRLIRGERLEFSALEILPFKELTAVERRWALDLARSAR